MEQQRPTSRNEKNLKQHNLPPKRIRKKRSKPKVSRTKVTIKIKEEKNETEKHTTIEKISETKSWFFEKINKIEKSLVNSSRKKEDPNKQNKRYKKIIREYYQQLYANKLGNLEEMDTCLETDNIPRLNEKEIDNLNSWTTSTETELLIKTRPANKTPGPDGFTEKFYQTYKEELVPILLKLFQKPGR